MGSGRFLGLFASMALSSYIDLVLHLLFSFLSFSFGCVRFFSFMTILFPLPLLLPFLSAVFLRSVVSYHFLS
jgi:hypothetical protein